MESAERLPFTIVLDRKSTKISRWLWFRAGRLHGKSDGVNIAAICRSYSCSLLRNLIKWQTDALVSCFNQCHIRRHTHTHTQTLTWWWTGADCCHLSVNYIFFWPTTRWLMKGGERRVERRRGDFMRSREREKIKVGTITDGGIKCNREEKRTIISLPSSYGVGFWLAGWPLDRVRPVRGSGPKEGQINSDEVGFASISLPVSPFVMAGSSSRSAAAL